MDRRGWVITEDGSFELPDPLLDDEFVRWPLGMPTEGSAASTAMFAVEDLYWRHEVIPDEAYVYLKRSCNLADIPEDEIRILLRS